jgi:hypothetical protein
MSGVRDNSAKKGNNFKLTHYQDFRPIAPRPIPLYDDQFASSADVPLRAKGILCFRHRVGAGGFIWPRITKASASIILAAF